MQTLVSLTDTSSPTKWSMLLLLLMLEAANVDLVFTISLKRSTQNLQLSTNRRPITPSQEGQSGHAARNVSGPSLTHSGHRDQFAERALRNIRRSLRLDIGCSDHLAPLVGRVGDEVCEFSGCQLHRLKAQAHKARFNIGFDDDGVDILVELFDNLGGSALGRTNAPPSAGLVARHKLIHGRNLRQYLRARRTGHRES